MIRITPTDLHADLSATQVHELYYDSHHLNRNGAIHFTAAAMPALLAVLSDVSAPK